MHATCGAINTHAELPLHFDPVGRRTPSRFSSGVNAARSSTHAKGVDTSHLDDWLMQQQQLTGDQVEQRDEDYELTTSTVTAACRSSCGGDRDDVSSSSPRPSVAALTAAMAAAGTLPLDPWVKPVSSKKSRSGPRRSFSPVQGPVGANGTTPRRGGRIGTTPRSRTLSCGRSGAALAGTAFSSPTPTAAARAAAPDAPLLVGSCPRRRLDSSRRRRVSAATAARGIDACGAGMPRARSASGQRRNLLEELKQHSQPQHLVSATATSPEPKPEHQQTSPSRPAHATTSASHSPAAGSPRPWAGLSPEAEQLPVRSFFGLRSHGHFGIRCQDALGAGTWSYCCSKRYWLQPEASDWAAWLASTLATANGGSVAGVGSCGCDFSTGSFSDMGIVDASLGGVAPSSPTACPTGCCLEGSLGAVPESAVMVHGGTDSGGGSLASSSDISLVNPVYVAAATCTQPKRGSCPVPAAAAPTVAFPSFKTSPPQLETAFLATSPLLPFLGGCESTSDAVVRQLVAIVQSQAAQIKNLHSCLAASGAPPLPPQQQLQQQQQQEEGGRKVQQLQQQQQQPCSDPGPDEASAGHRGLTSVGSWMGEKSGAGLGSRGGSETGAGCGLGNAAGGGSLGQQLVPLRSSCSNSAHYHDSVGSLRSSRGVLELMSSAADGGGDAARSGAKDRAGLPACPMSKSVGQGSQGGKERGADGGHDSNVNTADLISLDDWWIFEKSGREEGGIADGGGCPSAAATIVGANQHHQSLPNSHQSTQPPRKRPHPDSLLDAPHLPADGGAAAMSPSAGQPEAPAGLLDLDILLEALWAARGETEPAAALTLTRPLGKAEAKQESLGAKAAAAAEEEEEEEEERYPKERDSGGVQDRWDHRSGTGAGSLVRVPLNAGNEVQTGGCNLPQPLYCSTDQEQKPPQPESPGGQQVDRQGQQRQEQGQRQCKEQGEEAEKSGGQNRQQEHQPEQPGEETICHQHHQHRSSFRGAPEQRCTIVDPVCNQHMALVQDHQHPLQSDRAGSIEQEQRLQQLAGHLHQLHPQDPDLGLLQELRASPPPQPQASWDSISEASLRLEVDELRCRLAQLEFAATQQRQLQTQQLLLLHTRSHGGQPPPSLSPQQLREQSQEHQHQERQQQQQLPVEYGAASPSPLDSQQVPQQPGAEPQQQRQQQQQQQQQIQQEERRRQFSQGPSFQGTKEQKGEEQDRRMEQQQQELQGDRLDALAREVASIQQQLRQQEYGNREVLDQLARGLEHMATCLLSVLRPLPPPQVDVATVAAAAGASAWTSNCSDRFGTGASGNQCSAMAAAVTSPPLRPCARALLNGPPAVSPRVDDARRQLRALQEEMRQMRAMMAAQVVVAAVATATACTGGGSSGQGQGPRQREGTPPWVTAAMLHRAAAAGSSAGDPCARIFAHMRAQQGCELQQQQQAQHQLQGELQLQVQQLQREVSELRKGEALTVEAQEALVDFVNDMWRHLDELRTSMVPAPFVLAAAVAGTAAGTAAAGGGGRPGVCLRAANQQPPPDKGIREQYQPREQQLTDMGLEDQQRNEQHDQQHQLQQPHPDQLSEMVAIIQSVNSMLSGSLMQAVEKIQSQGEEIEELKRCMAHVTGLRNGLQL
ncbi:hypothetical protein VOLCADRAFT_89361 [Volvox carteri f. nagariensis]|uniref:Uncharacterized protein n=1 Tax=Volvox carteri f. nagariensis TaxID=3068 RepID=D8TRI0_VOLCA|nr:uncharacterized protein VOLCADRAFT_89361 [Volvox carteri f. nagariensis]EFJ49896.1 hypothetical protein VOLCADRAFT_89361 [Volvox carteri f. nagariensis]|eukprot:XP_002948961.1 hypothetical protein VOLCADRAFT_89361 [Volvox carteri f. nagariensis]